MNLSLLNNLSLSEMINHPNATVYYESKKELNSYKLIWNESQKN